MPSPRPNRNGRETSGLVLLFGAMYLVQGIAEPTEGLIAQPVRSLLKSRGYTTAALAGFGALLSLPWSLKPLYGLLTDFFPILGTRRRSYLILTSAVSGLALLVLYLIPIPAGSYQLLLYLLLVPTIGIAFSDVVVDALMIEKRQDLGLTGVLLIQKESTDCCPKRPIPLFSSQPKGCSVSAIPGEGGSSGGWGGGV